MILQNIPHELRELNQWVAAGEDKHPLNPRTGQPASVTDPATWGTFHEAVSAGFRHIGFVLSKSDPYAIIDLDDPKTIKVDGVVMDNPNLEEVAQISVQHARILQGFESYAEISQSGKGIHIVCRGTLPEGRFGAKRGKVELYSAERYMICTGNVFKNLPITDQQPLVESLFAEMDAGRLQTADLVETESHLTDEQLYNLASTAENADKFNRLWRGDWHGNPVWPSQSEADFALLAMLGFYSPSNEQCRRMFRFSALGKRDKATKNDRYLNYALSKIRAKTPPPVDLSSLLKNERPTTETNNSNAGIGPSVGQEMEGEVDETDGTQSGEDQGTENGVGNSKLAYPPGFVGELADYFLSSAIRPVPEIALCAAIALTAGVVGRAFNISGTGLNQYLLVLAKTGSGKEGAATGIDQMISAARPTVPMIDEFVGPGAFASGQALVRVLDKCPCFVSVLGEFGLTLNAMCSPNANGAQIMLKKVLLDIYAKSGNKTTLKSSVYSDTDKNTKSIQAPNVTILGESNPEKFYEGLDAGIISEGLLPRFSIFEYTGPRPARNPNAFAPPPPRLVQFFGSLAAVAMQAQTTRMCSPVQMDVHALRLLDAYDEFATEQINSKDADINKQLWNRAHLKVLKMSALIAVAYNPHQPIISKDIAEWSIALIDRDVKTILSKFEAGEVGSGDVRLELDVRRAINDYLEMPPTDRRGYGCPEKMTGFPAIPFQYLRRRLRLLKNFRDDRRGANAALVATLGAMVEGEVLQRITPAQGAHYCGTNAPVYVQGPAW